MFDIPHPGGKRLPPPIKNSNSNQSRIERKRCRDQRNHANIAEKVLNPGGVIRSIVTIGAGQTAAINGIAGASFPVDVSNVQAQFQTRAIYRGSSAHQDAVNVTIMSGEVV